MWESKLPLKQKAVIWRRGHDTNRSGLRLNLLGKDRKSLKKGTAKFLFYLCRRAHHRMRANLHYTTHLHTLSSEILYKFFSRQIPIFVQNDENDFEGLTF
jgi:hypothetical protein